MKAVSIAWVFLAGAAQLAAQGNTFVGAGHADTSPLSLLAKDIKGPAMAPQRASAPVFRTSDTALPRGAYVIDKTDLIATPSDQRRILRSVHIDPAPQPSEAETERVNVGRPLGNASQKR